MNVTGNTTMPVVNNTYTIARREIDTFIDNYVKPYPGRFAAFTMADFAQWEDPVSARRLVCRALHRPTGSGSGQGGLWAQGH